MRILYKILALSLFSLPLAFAYASTSVSIQSLSPSTTVSAGQNISFTIAASGFSGPTYALSDSFANGSANSQDINTSGNFSWTPNSNDVGTHNFTITVSDSQGDTATVSETIMVTSVSATVSNPAIQGFNSGSSVIVGKTVTFTVAAPGFINPVFTLQDPFSNTTMSVSDINSAGYFSWTPAQQDVGTHNLNIYINDNSGHNANIPVSIVVAVPNITVTSITPGTTVTPGNQFTMTVSPAGFTNPSYTISDSFGGTSISNSNINSSGYFSWTPATNQDGTHTLTIYATDSSGHSTNTQMTVYVNSGVSVALTAPTPSTTVAPGTTVTFNTYAYGFTVPAYTLQDSLSGSSITNADINSSGTFTWTPTAKDAGVHTISVNASDTYSHVGSAQTTITVSGTPVTATAAAQPASQSDVSVPLPTTSTSGYDFTVYLSPGSTGQDVTELQTILQQDGYLSTAPTGYYGSLTEAAVIAYQAAHGINQLGVVGPATRAALNSGASTVTASTNASSGDGYQFSNFLDVGSTGQDVTELQNRLTALSIYSGPVTGYFGSLTQAAVEQFQANHGIEQVGYVGPSTRAALNGN